MPRVLGIQKRGLATGVMHRPAIRSTGQGSLEVAHIRARNVRAGQLRNLLSGCRASKIDQHLHQIMRIDPVSIAGNY